MGLCCRKRNSSLNLCCILIGCIIGFLGLSCVPNAGSIIVLLGLCCILVIGCIIGFLGLSCVPNAGSIIVLLSLIHI